VQRDPTLKRRGRLLRIGNDGRRVNNWNPWMLSDWLAGTVLMIGIVAFIAIIRRAVLEG